MLYLLLMSLWLTVRDFFAIPATPDRTPAWDFFNSDAPMVRYTALNPITYLMPANCKPKPCASYAGFFDTS